jgi:hypothetical protein
MVGISAAAPVAGGLILARKDRAELFDEESGRWLALPHPMAEPRRWTQLVSVPASALLASAASTGEGDR